MIHCSGNVLISSRALVLDGFVIAVLGVCDKTVRNRDH